MTRYVCVIRPDRKKSYLAVASREGAVISHSALDARHPDYEAARAEARRDSPAPSSSSPTSGNARRRLGEPTERDRHHDHQRQWWETHEHLVTMVQWQCATRRSRETISEAIEEPWSWREDSVSALLQNAGSPLVCRCGECGGREWSNGEELHQHLVELLDGGRSLNFTERQEEEAV